MSEHELWNELGNLYFMSGAYNQAANAYQRSIQADTEFGRPYSNLALTYVQQGKYDDAIELYRRSIELLADAKEKAISLNRLGNVYRHLKDYSRAVVAFQQADEFDPRSADEFPPAVPPRMQEAPALSSVLDEPLLDVIYDAYEPVEPVTEALGAIAEPVAEAVAELMTEAPLAEVAAEPVVDIAFERVETLTEIPVAEITETPVEEVPVLDATDQPAAEAPIADIVQEPVAEVAAPEPALEISEEPVAETPIAEIVEEPVAEAAVLEVVEQPIAEAPVLGTVEQLVDEAPVLEVLDEPVAAAAEETMAALPEPPDDDIVYEPAADATEEAPVEFPDEPREQTVDERMTKRLNFLVGEALDEARMAIAEQAIVESNEPETEPELDWWDVEDDRFESATGTHSTHADLIEDPSTWTPADLSQFQQDVSQMPDSGSLTTWGDADFEDDFERWSPLDPTPDVEVPDPDSENISTWLPVPEESPLSFDELHVSPFVDEPEESEPSSDWETLPRYRTVDTRHLAPILPSTISKPAPAEVPARSEATTNVKKTWEQHVDVAIQDRPAADFTVVPQEQPSRIEVEPAPRPAQPELVLAPAMPEAAPAERAQPDRDEQEQREIELGIEKFRRVVQLNPSNARAWDSLGSLYKSAGMYHDATLAYQQAISHDSTKSLYYHHLGLVYACEGRDADAIAAFQRVIEIDPEYSLAHATLGGYYRKMGLEELAQKHIGKAMKNIFDSENEYNRACLEAICGNADQAIKLLDVALKNKQTYVDWILRDPDLDFIRQDPRFKQLISRYTR